MNIDYDKISNLLERVTSGNAGEVYVNLDDNGKLCTITWKRPKNLVEHESLQPRYVMLMYVKSLLEDEGVVVSLKIEVTQEVSLPEDWPSRPQKIFWKIRFEDLIFWPKMKIHLWRKTQVDFLAFKK